MFALYWRVADALMLMINAAVLTMAVDAGTTATDAAETTAVSVTNTAVTGTGFSVDTDTAFNDSASPDYHTLYQENVTGRGHPLCILCFRYCASENATDDSSALFQRTCACKPGSMCNPFIPYASWMRNYWYRVPLICLECISIMSVVLTLNMYTWMLAQRDVSNYTKHYLMSLLVSIIANVADAALDSDERSLEMCKIINYIKLFVLVCTNSWQIVMSVEIFCFLRHLDKLNMFAAKLPLRNKIYHLCCWFYSITWLSIAVYLEFKNAATVAAKSPTTYEPMYSETLLNYWYAFFYLVPGLFNIIISLILLTLYKCLYDEQIRTNQNGSKCLERLLIRKQLSMLLTFLWLIDLITFIDKYNEWLPCQVVQDFSKASQGTMTCIILVLKRNILEEMCKKLDQIRRQMPPQVVISLQNFNEGAEENEESAV